MSRILLLFMSLAMVACAKNSTEQCYQSMPSLESFDGRPAILVIGDSISMGYGPYVRESLDQYDVQHNPCNAYDSRNTARRIDGWLKTRSSWHAITFNNGIWDQTVGDTWVGDDEYRANLTFIARAIKARTARPLFILSTEIPVNTPDRLNARIVRKNEIAVEVMDAEGIPWLDLYSYSRTINHLHSRAAEQDDVHFTEEGYEALAEKVLEALNPSL